MKPPRKLHIKSYGCQMNVYDAQRMVDTLAPEGFVETASVDDADLVILNTCHIREKASEKVYSELGRLRVVSDGVVIAETTHALTLKEASYPAVQYVPRADAKMELLKRTDRVTHCPYKGDASYFSVVASGKAIENAIWTYETPFPAMAEISGHLAFYPDKVKIEEVAS